MYIIMWSIGKWWPILIQVCLCVYREFAGMCMCVYVCMYVRAYVCAHKSMCVLIYCMADVGLFT